MTLYAKWKPVPYSISYNLDGGSVSVNNPVSYDISSNSFTLQNPERDGYEFVGWTGTDISSETENVTIPQGSYGDREYVAVWHKLADSVTVSPDDCEVPQGSTCKLTAEVSPKEAYNKSVKWTSSDTCIAKVSDLGVVTAVSQGTAVITATAADGSSKQGTCSVTVVKPAAAVTAAPVAGTLIYSGDAQPLVSEGEVTGGIMNYALADGKVTKLPSGAKFGADIPTAAAVGAYTVFYKAVGDSDHTDSQYAFVHAAIGKAVPKYDPPVNKTIACGQTLQDIDLPDGFAIENNQTEPEIGESKTIRLTYTPSDTANFETVAGIEITVKAQHALSETKAVTSTCTEKGNDAYWTCSRCGKYFSDAEGKTEIAANAWVTDSVGHQYGTPVYIWSEDGKSCTASVTCKRNAKHIVTENAVVTSKVTTAPTCKEKGITTYTAVFQNTLFTEQTKAISDVPKSATHTQNDAVKENENASTCDTEGSYDMVVYCSVCGEELTRKTVTVKKHKLAKIEAIEPSCENTGNGTYWKCSVCGRCFSDEEGDNELNDNSWVKDALGHDYGTPEYKWSDDGKTCTATLICMREGCNEGIEGHKISQDAVITSVIKEKATIDKMGTTTYSATFNNTLFTTQTKDVVDIPKLEKEIDNPADNPGNDPADNPGNDPTDKSSTDKKQDTTTENPADVTPDKPQDQSTDKQTMPVETPTTPVVKEDGTILPVTEVKAEVVVTSKAGETPAVTYKGTTDDTAKVVEIPSTVIDSGVSYMVTEIAEDAFKDNTIIESVVISKNIETIGENAFSGCSNLKKVIIPESVTEISDGAFEGCIGLKTVELPKSVAKIGNKAFAGCTSLTNITIPAKVNKLGKDSFKGTKRLKILIVKTKKLTGKSVRNALKGSKIKIIRVNVGNKKLNKKYVKKYKKIFTKKNVGVKVVVR